MDQETKEFKDVQHKFCEEIITKLSKNPNAPPFLEPVDPVKLNIPDYPEKIKSPMDISTIKAKLRARQYIDTDKFRDDFKLMFNNCYTYNPKETMVYKMASELEKQFNTLFSRMPTDKKKRKTESANVSVAEKKTKKVARGAMKSEDVKVCEGILEEMLKSKHAAIMWPFLEPITDEMVPGYSDVIKTPTDIKTIKKKLAERQYDSVDDFNKELKMMVTNCFKFNSDTKKIYDCALEVEKLFNTLFTREQGGKDEIIKKIKDLRDGVNAIEKEILILEEALSEDERVKTRVKKEYTLDERLEIGRMICNLNQIQTTRIAQIVNKAGVPVDFVGKNEVEIDMRLLPDSCLSEIEEYLRNVSSVFNKENMFNDETNRSEEVY